MKIIRYNKTNIKTIVPGKPTVYIHSSGNFCFNQPGAKLLGITDYEATYYVEIIQDEEKPKDWYAMLSNETLGIKLRKEKNSYKYNFNAGRIAKKILSTLPKKESGVAPNTATLLIGSDPLAHGELSLIPIITSSYRPSK